MNVIEAVPIGAVRPRAPARGAGAAGARKRARRAPRSVQYKRGRLSQFRGNLSRPGRSLRPAVQFLSRRLTETIGLESIAGIGPTQGWSHHDDSTVGIYNAMSKAFQFKLSDLPNATEFTNLWTSYRITHVDFTITCSSQNGQTYGSVAPAAPSNMILRFRTNRYGLTTAGISQAQWNEVQSQNIRYLNGTKPITQRVNLNQSNVLYAEAGALGADYSAQSPQFISTGESQTPHYGVAMRVEMIDNAVALAQNGQSIRVDMNVHLELKGIK